jgi:uncharacterized membrane protein YqjE
MTEQRAEVKPPITTNERPRESGQSLGELVKEVADDVLALMRQELELAKLEIKDEAKGAARAGGMLGAAAVATHIFLIFLTLTVVFALDQIMPIAWASCIAAVVWGIGAYVLFAAGRRRMAAVNFTPQQTIETLKEDAQWAQNRNS